MFRLRKKGIENRYVKKIAVSIKSFPLQKSVGVIK